MKLISSQGLMKLSISTQTEIYIIHAPRVAVELLLTHQDQQMVRAWPRRLTNKNLVSLPYLNEKYACFTYNFVPERMKKGWRSVVYAFYEPDPVIEYRGTAQKPRKCHVFKCLGKGCGKTVVRYLDTGDAQSTGNMHKHVTRCWGPEILKTADEASNLKEAQEKIVKTYQKSGSITSFFSRKFGKGRVTYSHTQHTSKQARYGS